MKTGKNDSNASTGKASGVMYNTMKSGGSGANKISKLKFNYILMKKIIYIILSVISFSTNAQIVNTSGQLNFKEFYLLNADEIYNIKIYKINYHGDNDTNLFFQGKYDKINSIVKIKYNIETDSAKYDELTKNLQSGCEIYRSTINSRCYSFYDLKKIKIYFDKTNAITKAVVKEEDGDKFKYKFNYFVSDHKIKLESIIIFKNNIIINKYIINYE